MPRARERHIQPVKIDLVRRPGPTVDDDAWMSENQASDALGHARFNVGAWGKFIGYLDPAYNSRGRYGVTRASVEREVEYRAGRPSRRTRARRVVRRLAEFMSFCTARERHLPFDCGVLASTRLPPVYSGACDEPSCYERCTHRRPGPAEGHPGPPVAVVRTDEDRDPHGAESQQLAQQQNPRPPKHARSLPHERSHDARAALRARQLDRVEGQPPPHAQMY